MKTPFSKREFTLLIAVAFIGIVVLPCLNAFVAPDSPFHVSNFAITVYGKYLCYAVLALGVNLLWGYTGLLSLGQALFFSLGGYARMTNPELAVRDVVYFPNTSSCGTATATSIPSAARRSSRRSRTKPTWACCSRRPIGMQAHAA